MPSSFCDGLARRVGLAALGLCLALGLAGNARSDEPDEVLKKAKKSYYEATDKARATLLEGFASTIKTATASGNLDVVKALQAEKEAFESSGKLPTSARMKAAVAAYQVSLKQATTALDKAFEQAVKDFTKAGKLAQADAAQAELKEFRSRAPAAHLKPADVTTKEDLRKYLIDTVWTWDEGLRFKADGYVEQKQWTSAGLVTKWEAIDRRTVLLWIEKGREENRYAVLTFSEDLSELRGFDFNGKDRLPALKRKP
jgi:hypothetical protein